MADCGNTIVDILTGFLGSGKTTLLNRLLSQEAFRDTAVIVNELGEIGLDHLLVAESTDQIAVLEGGCLCCAVNDSLPETLLELCQRRAAGDLPAFTKVVIETTGLADPGPIITVLQNSPLLTHFLRLGSVVTVLDALSFEKTIADHPEAARQLVLADQVVLSKLDMREPLSESERAQILSVNPIAEIVPSARIHEDPSRLFRPLAEGGSRQKEAGPAHHSHGIYAHSFAIDDPVTRAGLANFTSELTARMGGALLRCKGLVELRNRAVLIQGVGKRFTFTELDRLPDGAVSHITCIVQQREREEIADLIPLLRVPEGTMPHHS